jgi:helix-turn-helix protein
MWANPWTKSEPSAFARMPRHQKPNPRSVKIHRSYDVDEAARMLHVHRNTVRAWIKHGLPTIDRKRPVLIHGLDLFCFLTARRATGKQRCGAGQFFCVKCRAPQTPALGMVDYIPLSRTAGNLQGLCPACGTLIYRRVSLARLAEVQGDFEIKFPQGVERITDST